MISHELVPIVDQALIEKAILDRHQAPAQDQTLPPLHKVYKIQSRGSAVQTPSTFPTDRAALSEITERSTCMRHRKAYPSEAVNLPR